ncbi:MAG: hypothetical protein HZB55_19600 [Deltaproteobacteria bacterium]|nr:hypothetical protein [Deltaproteobacteria bacterium]
MLYAPYPGPEDEINLLDLLRVLGRRWWLIALVTALGTGGAVLYALKAPPIFRAKAVIAPPAPKQAGGASAALAALGGIGAELAGSMGFSAGGADANRLEALLKSHRLRERVVTKYTLLPVLFPEQWDGAAKKWKTDSAETEPNIWDAEKRLDKVFLVKNDIKTGVVNLSLELGDPRTAQEILRHFLDELASTMQQDELAKIRSNEEFARQQLRRATDPIVIAKLQAILSEQLDKAMMAQNLEDFAFEVIDPPAGSDQKVRPRKALIGAGGAAGSFSLGVFLALLAEWVRKARAMV